MGEGGTVTKVERRFFDFVQKHLPVFLAVAATLCGLLIRFAGKDFQSGDFVSFLNPWWSQIQEGGLAALKNQVGNYNIPYQVIIYILTLFPLKSLYAYKLLSVVFDFVLAFAAGLLVGELTGKKSPFVFSLTYAVVFCSITVCFNSAFWAQCDSIYVAFILLSLYYLLRRKHIAAFALLGVALAFKLQTVFVLPVYLYDYVTTRKTSILHFLIAPAVDVLMCLPVVFLGRNPADIIRIYIEQTDYGKYIQMNCPNFYAILCNGDESANYFLLKNASVALTVLILGIGLCMLIYKKVDLSDKNKFMLSAIWSVFTCLMFLSSMHERYGYLLDVLVIIYVIAVRKRYWLAVACNLVSLRGYCQYMFKYSVDIRLTAYVYFAVYVYVSYLFLREVISDRAQNTPPVAEKKC